MVQNQITVELAWDEGEASESPNGAGSRELVYIIRGTNDRELAMRAFIDQAAQEVAGLIVGGWQIGRLTETEWRGVAQYGMLEITGVRESPLAAGEAEFSLDTTGGTKKVVQYLDQPRSFAPSGKTAPDFKGLINVTKDGVDGVEIGDGVDKITITRVFERSQVPVDYFDRGRRLRYHVNNAYVTLNIDGYAFNFAPGELLFLGWNCSYSRASKAWRISYYFAGNANESGLKAGDIDGIDKLGWEYIWFATVEETDDTAVPKRKIKKPIAAYVGPVYGYGDLNQLAI